MSMAHLEGEKYGILSVFLSQGGIYSRLHDAEVPGEVHRTVGG